VGGLIGANFVLHLLYGAEAFLYSMHYTPLVAIAAAWSLADPRSRNLARALMAAAIVCGVAHNAPAFMDAVTWHNALPPPDGLPDGYTPP
jgi:hypothetical protein